MCVAECDANSILTNCQHFLCSRCWNKYPKGQCPRCHKACRTLSLSAPNFPAEVQERLRFDVKRHLTMSVQALEFQQRLEQGATQRLKEITTQLHQQLRSTMQQLADAQRQLQHKSDEAKTLQVEVNVLRDQLREVHMSGRSSGGQHNSQHTSSAGGGGAMRNATPAMSMIPMHSSQQNSIMGGGGAVRSPSGFRCDFGDLPHSAPSAEVPLSPFGTFGASRLNSSSSNPGGGSGSVLPPTPHPQQHHGYTQQQPQQQPPAWSPSSANATPLGWSRDPKRPRDEPPTSNASGNPTAPSGGTTEHFRLGLMQPLSQTIAGATLPQNLTPLPKLKSLLSGGGARLVRPSSGHDYA
jgi:hypothetical protein